MKGLNGITGLIRLIELKWVKWSNPLFSLLIGKLLTPSNIFTSFNSFNPVTN